MRTATGLAAAFLGVFSALLLQQALPSIHVLHGARFVFAPLVFCLAAMSLPFPAMLAAAFLTGLLCDLMYLHVVGGRVEIALGCSIVFFVIYGSIANGFRPAFLQGRWWPLVPMSFLGTSAFLLLQLVMLSLRRESFEYHPDMVWRILAPGLLAALVAPVLFAAVRSVSELLPWESTARRDY